MDSSGDIAARGKYGSKEMQEDKGGAARRWCHRRCVRGGSEALDLIGGGGRGEPLELRPSIRVGGEWGG